MEDGVILKDIRDLLVGDSEDDSFDKDLIILINSAFNTLTQLGVGSESGFRITKDGEEKWNDFTGDNILLEKVKAYIMLKVRVLFDPPTSSFVLEAYKKEIEEMEWRLNVTVDDQTGGN